MTFWDPERHRLLPALTHILLRLLTVSSIKPFSRILKKKKKPTYKRESMSHYLTILDTMKYKFQNVSLISVTAKILKRLNLIPDTKNRIIVVAS